MITFLEKISNIIKGNKESTASNWVQKGNIWLLKQVRTYVCMQIWICKYFFFVFTDKYNMQMCFRSHKKFVSYLQILFQMLHLVSIFWYFVVKRLLQQIYGTFIGFCKKSKKSYCSIVATKDYIFRFIPRTNMMCPKICQNQICNNNNKIHSLKNNMFQNKLRQEGGTKCPQAYYVRP